MIYYTLTERKKNEIIHKRVVLLLFYWGSKHKHASETMLISDWYRPGWLFHLDDLITLLYV